MEVVVVETSNPEWFRLCDARGNWITEGKAIYISMFVERNDFTIVRGEDLLS